MFLCLKMLEGMSGMNLYLRASVNPQLTGLLMNSHMEVTRKDLKVFLKKEIKKQKKKQPPWNLQGPQKKERSKLQQRRK